MVSEIITFENKSRFGKEKHQNFGVKVKVDKWNGKAIDKEAIIRVCLLHDMGNTVKIPEEFSNDENFIETRRKYFEKYGTNGQMKKKQII